LKANISKKMKDSPILVKNFSEFMLEYKINGKKFIKEFLNLVEMYNMPFDADNVYELFENCHHVLDFYKIKTMPSAGSSPRRVYSCNDGDSYLPFPDTIDDFIFDCKKHWKINLYWEKNLVKRDWRVEI